jgi:hypothetical protein
MREQLGTAIGLTIGVLINDAIRGILDLSSFLRATIAFLLSFALLTLLAVFRRSRAER